MVITDTILDSLTEKARKSPRLREHLLLHRSSVEPSQRIVCAMEPDSYMQPHRHFSDPKHECLLGVRGKIAVITFEEDGDIREVDLLSSTSGGLIVQLEPEVIHTVVSLDPGSVFFETKQGPYQPLQSIDVAPWAPEQGDQHATTYLEKLRSALTQHIAKKNP